MYRGTIFLIFCLVIPAGKVIAQQLSHQVLVPLAGVTGTNKISYSHTIGETAVEIVGCINFTFTQGFQQPCIKFLNETPPPGTGANVYPNPVDTELTVELFGESSRNLRVEIVNITGTIVFSEKYSFTDQYWYKDQLNVDYLISGFYLVRIISEDGFINRTFRIEKL